MRLSIQLPQNKHSESQCFSMFYIFFLSSHCLYKQNDIICFTLGKWNQLLRSRTIELRALISPVPGSVPTLGDNHYWHSNVKLYSKWYQLLFLTLVLSSLQSSRSSVIDTSRYSHPKNQIMILKVRSPNQ